MADDKIEPLLEEYRQLFAYVNSNALATLKVPPAVLTVVSGLAIYSDVSQPLLGFSVSIAFFLMLMWLG